MTVYGEDYMSDDKYWPVTIIKLLTDAGRVRDKQYNDTFDALLDGHRTMHGKKDSTRKWRTRWLLRLGLFAVMPIGFGLMSAVLLYRGMGSPYLHASCVCLHSALVAMSCCLFVSTWRTR